LMALSWVKAGACALTAHLRFQRPLAMLTSSWRYQWGVVCHVIQRAPPAAGRRVSIASGSAPMAKRTPGVRVPSASTRPASQRPRQPSRQSFRLAGQMRRPTWASVPNAEPDRRRRRRRGQASHRSIHLRVACDPVALVRGPRRVRGLFTMTARSRPFACSRVRRVCRDPLQHPLRRHVREYRQRLWAFMNSLFAPFF